MIVNCASNLGLSGLGYLDVMLEKNDRSDEHIKNEN